ncbi:MAG: hypothetical protein L3K23_03925 [Thermoplasmata archaeon]|nr:hypothetical protein [Thermoplasmata archaeon]
MEDRSSGGVRAPRAVWRSRLLAGSVGVVIAILFLTSAAHASVFSPAVLFGKPQSGPLSPPQTSSSGPHFSATTCTAKVSNATLTQGIVHLYEGNGNTSGSGSGLINQGPPGVGAYPRESVAVLNVVNGWLAVCESPAYYALVHQWGDPSFPWNALAQNSSGIYEYVIAVNWQAPATSCPANSNSGAPCMGSAEWLINVASGMVSGPKTWYWAIQPAL